MVHYSGSLALPCSACLCFANTAEEEAAEEQLLSQQFYFQSSDAMPRLVRRRPLMERIQAYLNPWDFLLWVSEEIDGHDWDQMEKDWGLSIGVGLNLIFLIARANSRSSGGKAFDDVFGEDEGVPWLSWLVRDLLLQPF